MNLWIIEIGLSCLICETLMAEVPLPILPEPSHVPSEAQKKQIARRYGMFICFSVNTFVDKEWTDGSVPAKSYAPTAVEADQWVRVAKEAGMKFVLFVTKHHDGFCLWDSPLTEYDVGNSGNQTNVVVELAKACQKHGIGLALYYSLWDRKKNPNVKDVSLDAAYNEYMLKQLGELFDMTKSYGPIVEFWFDGGWVKPNSRWPLQEIYTLIKSRDPQCQVGINWTIGKPGNPDFHKINPDQQKVGYPIRYFPSDFRLGDPLLPVDNDPKLFSHDGKLYYMPFESTVCMSKCWFYNTKDNVWKSVDELESIYHKATQNDNILILNCPPDRNGKMRQKDIDLLMELKQRIDVEKHNNLTYCR